MEMVKVSQCVCDGDGEGVSRCSCVVQLKQLEIQLEEEYEDKQKVLRERRELDTKLISAQDQVPAAVMSTHIRSRHTVTGGSPPGM